MSVGTAAQLDLGTPRGEASTELAELLADGRALRGRVDAIDREQREANERSVAASAALAEFERRGLAGDDVGADRKRLETGLAKAKGAAAEPWAERRAGGQQAVRDHDQQVVRFVDPRRGCRRSRHRAAPSRRRTGATASRRPDAAATPRVPRRGRALPGSGVSDASRDVFELGRLAKEERRRELLEALTRTGRETSVLDDDELLDRLADRVVDRLLARLEQEGASST
jgi:hypothetical protein